MQNSRIVRIICDNTDLNHDAALDELVKAGPGHQVQEGPEQKEDEDNLDNWKQSTHELCLLLTV